MEKRCFASAVTFLVLSLAVMDGVFLGYIRKGFWDDQVRKIQGSPPKYRMGVAMFAYTVMVVVIFGLAVTRVRKDHLLRDSLLWGGLTGLAMYGVFNGTNRAIFKNYSLEAFWTDMAWGVFLTITCTYVAAYASYYIKIC